jgi:hypothetical protein
MLACAPDGDLDFIRFIYFNSFKALDFIINQATLKCNLLLPGVVHIDIFFTAHLNLEHWLQHVKVND